MDEAQVDTGTAPFAHAKANRLRLATPTSERMAAVLDVLAAQDHFVATLTGPDGIGKRTALEDWAGRARERFRTAWLEPRELYGRKVASDILRAFGLRPIDGADPSEALFDFVADARAEGQPAVLVVPDITVADPDGRRALARLTVPRKAGGAGLNLMSSSADHRAAVGEPVEIDPPRPEDIEAFLNGLVALSPGGPSLEPAACARIAREAGGSLERAGEALDRLMLSRKPREASPPSPTASEIERALLALQGAETPEADTKPPVIEGAKPAPAKESGFGPTSSPTERRELRPRGSERPFPKIETAYERAQAMRAANDPDRQLENEVADDLRAIIREAAALQGALLTLRTRTEQLQARMADRSTRLARAASDFLDGIASEEDAASPFDSEGE
jgi:hypothetical protein